jgi:hypothetical protein
MAGMNGKPARRWGYDSRGTPAVVHLPGCLAIALLVFLPLAAPELIGRCIGHVPDVPSNKGGAAALSALAALCSPLLFVGPGRELVIGIVLVALIIASLWARHWMQQHQAHWDVVRAEERAKRAEKRRLKAEAERGDSG